jgi:hypothetical protein
VLTARWMRAVFDKSLTMKILAALGAFVLSMSVIFYTLMEAAHILLDSHAVLLIGLETSAAAEGGRRVITLTGNGTLISGGDCAFVVAESMPRGLACAD